MITVLALHLFVAILTIVTSVAGLVLAYRRSDLLQRALAVLWASFGATTATGVALVVMTPQTLVHTCVMMSTYVIVVTAVHVYARQRVAVSIKG